MSARWDDLRVGPGPEEGLAVLAPELEEPGDRPGPPEAPGAAGLRLLLTAFDE